MIYVLMFILKIIRCQFVITKITPQVSTDYIIADLFPSYIVISLVF